MKTTTLCFLLAVVLSSPGCSDRPVSEGPDPETNPQSSTTVTLTGVITEKNDMVPVDGGVTMSLRTGNGHVESLTFPSLFTYPPPSQATVDLYSKISPVKVGDRVRIVGKREDGGIALVDLEILENR